MAYLVISSMIVPAFWTDRWLVSGMFQLAIFDDTGVYMGIHIKGIYTLW